MSHNNKEKEMKMKVETKSGSAYIVETSAGGGLQATKLTSFGAKTKTVNKVAGFTGEKVRELEKVKKVVRNSFLEHMCYDSDGKLLFTINPFKLEVGMYLANRKGLRSTKIVKITTC